MKKLHNGDYLVPAIRASEAIEVIRNHVPTSHADSVTAVELNIPVSLESKLWLVRPHWPDAPHNAYDNALADPNWISAVTPTGWNVVVDTKHCLLVIRNNDQSLCYVESLVTDLLFRGRVRSAFAKLGIVID